MGIQCCLICYTWLTISVGFPGRSESLRKCVTPAFIASEGVMNQELTLAHVVFQPKVVPSRNSRHARGPHKPSGTLVPPLAVLVNGST